MNCASSFDSPIRYMESTSLLVDFQRQASGLQIPKQETKYEYPFQSQVHQIR